MLYAILGGCMATWHLRPRNVSQHNWSVNGGVSLLPTSLPSAKHILAGKLPSLGNRPCIVDCCSDLVGREE